MAIHTLPFINDLTKLDWARLLIVFGVVFSVLIIYLIREKLFRDILELFIKKKDPESKNQYRPMKEEIYIDKLEVRFILGESFRIPPDAKFHEYIIGKIEKYKLSNFAHIQLELDLRKTKDINSGGERQINAIAQYIIDNNGTSMILWLPKTEQAAVIKKTIDMMIELGINSGKDFKLEVK